MFSNVMRISISVILASVCLLVLVGVTTAQSSSTEALKVSSTRVDIASSRIIIEGENFGTEPPAVFLSSAALNVISSSDHEIVVALPNGTTSGVYILEVTREGDATEAGRVKTPIVVPEN